MARAWRGTTTLVPWAALGAVEGFGPAEEDDQPIQGFTRRLTFPFRATGPRAIFDTPLPPGEGPILLSLMVAHLAPDDGPSLWTHWTLDGHPAMTLALRPGTRPGRVRLLVPAAIAARGAVRVAIETTTWQDPRIGRDLGLLVGSEWLTAVRVPTDEHAEAALARVHDERRAEDSLDPAWWHAAESLYVGRRVTRASLAMGPEDDTQLGPGWHHREDWGRLGAMRWTGARAVTHLRAGAGAATARLRAYSGQRELGPVEGQIAADHAPPGGPLSAAGVTPFRLDPDSWAELTVPVPPGPGHVRLTIEVPAPRVPRDLIPGSRDARPLGLAVQRLWLA
jgi:hypothetical protein